MSEQRTINYFLAKLQPKMHHLREQFGVSELGLFGSYVRGEEKTGSDLDVLVSFSRTPALSSLIELESYIGKLLEVEIDLVIRETLRPRIGKRILDELVPV